MATIREAIERGRSRLRGMAIDSPGREAALLLGDLTGMSEAALLAHDDESLPAAVLSRFDELVERRAAREPMAYLLGRREFWGRSFRVDSRVLIPRPETELLVELALGLDLPAGARVVDVGTGSGCLAVTLALERPGWTVVGTDRSPAALAVARGNGQRLGARNVRWLAADLVSGLGLHEVDLLIANLPYVDRADSPTLAPELGFEPASALFAEDAGLAAISRLLDQAAGLSSGGRIAVELGAGQAEALAARVDRALLEPLGALRDTAGVERVALWRRVAGADPSR